MKSFIVIVDTPKGLAYISHSARFPNDPSMRDIRISSIISEAVIYLETEVQNLIVDLEFYVSSGQLPFTYVEAVPATIH